MTNTGIKCIEFLTHDRDFSIEFAKKPLLEQLLPFARSNAAGKEGQFMARVPDSALWNNPDGLDAVQGTSLAAKSVDMLRNEDVVEAQASLAYTLSEIEKYGMRVLKDAYRSQVLQEIFTKDKAGT